MRTPIIAPGQVYLHPTNEYLVVTKSNRGSISYKGPGFSGLGDVESFLERNGPVDPADLTDAERDVLQGFVDGRPLITGWVQPDDEEE